jgi:hypothetical protein
MAGGESEHCKPSVPIRPKILFKKMGLEQQKASF